MSRPRLVSGIAVGVLIALLFLLPVLYVVMMAFESPSHFLVSPMTPGSPDVSNWAAGSQLSHSAGSCPNLRTMFSSRRRCTGSSSTMRTRAAINIPPNAAVPFRSRMRRVRLRAR